MTLLNTAIKLGACDKVKNIKNKEQLAKLFFSPQGVEFCLEHNFPSLDDFRDLEFDTTKYGVYIDTEVYLENTDVALINSKGKLKFRGTDRYYRVVLMHGSECEIEVSDYAVVRVDGIGAKFINDGTAVVL